MTSASPWSSFSQDPRRPESAPLRASDSDRDVVLGVLAEGYADGRLSKEEYDERAAVTTAAKTLGELPPVIADLVPQTVPRGPGDLVHATPDELEEQAVRRWKHARREAVNGVLVVAAICWTIWAVSGFGFPWPVFPTLFVAMRVPQVLMNKQEIVAKERERLEKKQRKALEARRPEQE
jgi:hypothetical protein